MARVKICDRCGKRIDERSVSTFDIRAFKYHRFKLEFENTYAYGEHDLCPDCMHDYKAFIKGAIVVPKEEEAETNG